MAMLEDASADADMGLVSIVIPAYNEGAFIDACLRSVRAQTHENLQVIVVDGASTDMTVDIVQHHMQQDARVELVHNPRRITPVQMNVGLAACRGRWLVRVDAHATVGPDYVARCLARLLEGWGAVGGRKDGIGLTPAGRAIAAAMGHPFGVGGSVYHHGDHVQEVDHVPFGAYPVDLCRELGGWNETLKTNQDFEFDYRVRQTGRGVLFDPQIIISWHCRQHIPDLFRQYHRYGRGKVAVARLHPDSLRWRHLAPPALSVLVAVTAAAGVSGRARAAGIAISPYVVSLAAASIDASSALDRPLDKALLPPAFAAMHLGWGLGFWSGVGAALKSEFMERKKT
jgi:hypothetical protein